MLTACQFRYYWWYRSRRGTDFDTSEMGNLVQPRKNLFSSKQLFEVDDLEKLLDLKVNFPEE